MHHLLTERLLKIQLGILTTAFVYWPLSSNIEENILKIVSWQSDFKLIRELLKFKFPFTLKLGVGENLNIFGDEICYFQVCSKRFVLSWVICTRCTCSLKQKHLGKRGYSFQESIWPFLGNSVQLLPDRTCVMRVKADGQAWQWLWQTNSSWTDWLVFSYWENSKSEAASFLFWKGNICLENWIKAELSINQRWC